MKRQISFRQTWLFSLMAIVILYTLVSLYINSRFLLKEIETDITERNMLEVSNTINVFDAYIDNISGIYANLLLEASIHNFSEDIQNQDLDYLEDLTYKIIGGNNIVQSIYFYDEESGNCYGSVDGLIKNYENLWLDQAMEIDGKGLISNEHQFSYVGKFEGGGEADLIIAINMNKSNLESKLLQNLPEDSVQQYITDQEGRILFGANEDKLWLDISGLDKEYGEEEIIGNNIKYFMFYGRSSLYDCYYIKYISREELLEPVLNSRNRILISLLLFTIIVIVISFKMSTHFSRPIYELTERMNTYMINKEGDKVKKGDFNPINNNINREYYALYNNFNEMVERIDRLIEDIKVTEALKSNEQVKNIQAAVRPHFAYNLMNSIVWLIYDGKNDEAAEVLIRTANFFRNSLKTQRNYVSIKDELDSLNNYFELLNFTMDDEFKWTFNCNERFYNCKIISLGLQPLVENSIAHGFKDKEGAKQIDILVEQLEDNVMITVKDNGKGVKEERLLEIRELLGKDLEVSNSYGLWNIQKRCHLLYGKKYGISIESEEGQGTKVVLTIPWEEHEYV